MTDVIVTRSDIIDHLLIVWFGFHYQYLPTFVTDVIVVIIVLVLDGITNL